MSLPRIALIGCGQWGRNLARNLAGLGVLRTISDPNSAVLASFAERYPGVRLEDDPRAALTDPEVDACVVAAPAALHYDMVRHALAAGKDVFVEKPLALTVKEGEALVALAERQRRILMVGHLLEYHPAIARLRQLVSTGELGKIQYVYSNRLNLGRIRTEENALWSFAPHDIHVLVTLLGELPVEVACQGGSYLSQHVADVTMSTMTFASGVRGHIFVSWLHPFKDQKLVVIGTNKMVVFDDTLPSERKVQLYPHRVDWIERIPVAVKAEAEAVAISDEEPLLEECRHFIDCVATRRRPRTDGMNGVTVLRILEACQQSLEKGGQPVSLLTTAAPAPRWTAHPTATVDAGCEIGEGTRIWHFCHVMPGARIGRGCSLGQNVFVAKDVVIGSNVKIQNNVSVYEGVVLEDDVFCGPSMVFTNVLTPRSHVSRKHEYRPTLVRKGATIGANATVLCGHTIGRYAFIGAGAVVTRDVPDFALMLGSPAHVAGWMCQCGVRLPLRIDDGEEAARCADCGGRFERVNQHVVMTGAA
ncbi:MAG: Gfo/Idh/MocA family oxidoreductase [Candidatus Rokubacteria bacterium]|nr:Gfo/Idh/MocA family oxidoreductase [Candidatus Rokubacteria bacterium]